MFYERKLEPDEDKVIAISAHCGQEIYEHEIYGEYGEDVICPDCLEEEWNKELIQNKLERMGYTPMYKGKEV